MTKAFAKILCPVEFDRISAPIIEYASEVAETEGGGMLYLLHVISPPSVDWELVHPHPILTEEVARRELEKLAQDHVARSVSHRTVVRAGDPAALIVEVAEELDVDLILMPTHGRIGTAHIMLGSVAERVVREAKRHVLILRPDLVRHRLQGG